MKDKILVEVYNQVYDQIGSRVSDRIWSRVSDRIWIKVEGQVVWDQVVDQVFVAGVCEISNER